MPAHDDGATHCGPAYETFKGGKRGREGGDHAARLERCARCQALMIFKPLQPRMRAQLRSYNTDIAQVERVAFALPVIKELGVAKLSHRTTST